MFPKETKILIVDDMMTMRKIVQKCLMDIGLSNVTAADDGETAWPEIEKAVGAGSPFQLIMSDWNMPKMKGIDLLRKVRALPAMKDVPFILVTAEAEKGQVAEGLQAGASSYIVKPFSADTMAEKLKAVFATLKK